MASDLTKGSRNHPRKQQLHKQRHINEQEPHVRPAVRYMAGADGADAADGEEGGTGLQLVFAGIVRSQTFSWKGCRAI